MLRYIADSMLGYGTDFRIEDSSLATGRELLDFLKAVLFRNTEGRIPLHVDDGSVNRLEKYD